MFCVFEEFIYIGNIYLNWIMLQLENRLPYNTKLKDRARYLRKNMTKPESKLWYEFLRKLPLNPPHLRGREFQTGS